jgi:hypothetical protein
MAQGDVRRAAVTLGSEIAGALPFLRESAESMMVDACTITRVSGAPVFDSATGTYTDPAPTTVYTGECRVRTRGKFLRDKTVQAGEADTYIWPYIVSVPVSVTTVNLLDIVTVTASRDPALVGAVMRVQIESLSTNGTARKLDCEEIAA